MSSGAELLNILLIGSGGREHAIAWRLTKSPRVEHVYVAPGNGGTAKGLSRVSNVPIDTDDFAKLTKFAVVNHINLVVPGPEQPIVDGIEAAFKRVGIPCFAPSAKAAVMEGSKAFAKNFMKKHNIPTATYESFSDYTQAKAYIESITHRVVIKASGLAAGKGVLIPANKEEALNALKEIMIDRVFGNAGDEVVIEEYLEGQELSVLAICDGYTIVPLPPAQDHKRAFDGDQGPNTGGMGCYCPTPIVTPELLTEIDTIILKPTITGMRHDGFPFVGILFTGLMITNSGPKVLEYNVRFGDPETETILPLLSDDSDLAEIMMACVERRLDSVQIAIKPGYAATVIIASGGYPGSYSKGKEITFNNLSSDALIFHAGTSINKNNKLSTSGGRVLAVSAVAPTLGEAVAKAYQGVGSIHFDSMYYRKDIGHRSLSTPKSHNTYASAGVSIDAGNLLVEKIKPLVKTTRRPGAEAEIGGFGGLFDLKPLQYSDPLLVAATDGVGTKLKIAQATNRYKTIGVDLVAMNVNDLIVQGAEPLFFLDYYACGKLQVNVATDVVSGIVDGCKEAGCALIGGETAEMPGLYKLGEYDLAGFCVGVVERNLILPRLSLIKPGDTLLGLASSGLHSNGFSLVRKIIDSNNLTYASSCPWDTSITLGQALLVPTRIYVKQVMDIVKGATVKGLSHITGGGFYDNIPRILPDDVGVVINARQWEVPPVFKWLARVGNIQPDELLRTFNCGIGMVIIVPTDAVDNITHQLQGPNWAKVFNIGRVVGKQDIEGNSVVVEEKEALY
ncbi:9441_t:CDS:10 [Paraglomus brasilianum]|uniref:9441_t:CDS:1 n=1 Tax=Paraglomus brasilianum TaxID=144538 RepID=A0A9N9BC49_9GLOM|nr:9441_t:CDS:10 [Paraglomus brasilianum]